MFSLQWIEAGSVKQSLPCFFFYRSRTRVRVGISACSFRGKLCFQNLKNFTIYANSRRTHQHEPLSARGIPQNRWGRSYSLLPYVGFQARRFQGSRDFGWSLLMILTAVGTSWMGSIVFTTLHLSFNPMRDEGSRAYCLEKNLNASRPFEHHHPPVRWKSIMCSRPWPWPWCVHYLIPGTAVIPLG